MKKRTILVISALVTAVAVMGGFALQNHRRAAQYERLLDDQYTHAYYELSTAVSELDAALQKARYTATPVLLGVLCTDIYGKAVAAQMALGELPASDVTLEQTSAFLARVGDYACSLSRAAAVGGLDEDSHATLHALADAAATLSASLLHVQAGLLDGSVPVSTLILAEEALAQAAGDGGAAAGGTAFQQVEADFPEVPTLIYDGPFSEHLSSRTPLALAGLPQVDPDAAQAAAADFLGLSPAQLQLTGSGDGVLPTWGFSAGTEGGELYIEVTRQGGQILSLIHSRTVQEQRLTTFGALQAAQSFLKARGYPNMQETYHIRRDNVLTVNYAPVQDGVLCYPDLVKVSVALDDGSIVGFESHGRIMNHHPREFSAPAVTAEEAAAVLSPGLEVLSHRLALIPTGGEYEVLCHEFRCRTGEDTHILVYVNAATGNEEQILLLLEDANGTLVR